MKPRSRAKSTATMQYEWYRYDTLLTLPDPIGRTGAIPSYPTC